MNYKPCSRLMPIIRWQFFDFSECKMEPRTRESMSVIKENCVDAWETVDPVV